MANSGEDPPLTDSTQKSETVLATPPISGASSARGGTLSLEPVTDEMFEKAGTTVNTAISSIRQTPPAKQTKPTVLKFEAVQEQPRTAKCQLVLCNISDRVLHFRLKSSSGSNIVSVPFANGHIAPHAQIRLTLTWSRAEKYKSWVDIPPPKLILTTKFLDISPEESELTHTRIVAKLGKKHCSGSTPPVEQLLLDAGKAEKQEQLDEPMPKETNLGQTLADFVNNLSDRGIVVLILILAIVVLHFTSSHQR